MSKFTKQLKNLRDQLSRIGINRAVAEPVMYDGSQMIYVRWNGDEEIFSGYDELDPEYVEYTEQRLSQFMDENLS